MSTQPRSYTFEPTPAVVESRSRSQYVDCAVCQADHSQYLFHKTGVRFVRCRTCGMVYANPVSESGFNYFDMDARGFEAGKDRELTLADFDRFLEAVEAEFTRVEGRAPARALVLGKFMRDFRDVPAARRMNLAVADIDDEKFQRLRRSDISWAADLLAAKPEVVVLHELLEVCADPGKVLGDLIKTLPKDTWFAATYTNAESIPARIMRRHWKPFFDVKSVFFNTANMTALMARHGLVLGKQLAFPVTHTMQYVANRLGQGASVIRMTPIANLPLPIRAGNRAAIFRGRRGVHSTTEKVSIVLPVFNEAKSCAKVIDAVLEKQLKIDKEVIIVESNSTDGTRDIVKTYEGRPGVQVVYEERPRGKGHAVRTGLKAVTGTIVLIQDADFEYDIDDYDALLEPILQHRATFVLGSRSLGLDDWKVRKFARGKGKAFLLNFAQLIFARTYNVLYQQDVTDVNTMFKVFRSECLEGMDLESDGFELDIELACKLAKNGNAPMEVPVNYVARGFDEGKKISFVRDSIPSYFAFFKYRFK
jgi:ribosomal protein S27E